MLEAIVGVALRAILASVVLGAVLSALVLIVTRRLALTAATRHALWTVAMIATAAMPLAGLAVSLARATPAQAVAPWTPAGGAAATGSVSQPTRSLATRDGAIAGTSAATPDFAGLRAPALALAGWTPRLTRALAIGVVGIWSLGALIGLIGLAASLVRIRGLKRRSSPLDGVLADELPWLTATGPGREIYLRLSYEIETPVAIGFGRPVILIPTELAGDGGGLAALEPLVLHEHAHLRRYDDWTNLVQRTIERVFWFNPIVWLVGRRIALEREIASDDAVVEKTGEAHAYATSLWRLAREMRMPEHAVVAPGALLTRKQIAVRIEQLLDANRGRLRRSPAAALVTAVAGVVAVAFVATSAPAVELPTPPEPVPAAWASPKPAGRARTPNRVAQRDARPAAAAVAAPRLPAKTTVVVYKVVTRTTSPPPRTVVVYVTPKPATRKVPAGQAVTSQPVVPERVAVAPPPLPEMPKTAAHDFPPIPPALPSNATPAAPALPPKALAAIRAAASLGNVVSHALAHIPGDLAALDAQDEMPARHVVPIGTKLSREMVAACKACSFRDADLRGLDLHGLTLKADDFGGADLRGVNLSGASLIGVSLRRTNLGNADLRGAHLSGVDLRGALLGGARLDDITLLGVSLHGLGVSGVPVGSIIAECVGCDLSRLDLHGLDLHGISLTGADLSHADLHGASLNGAHLMGVDLSGANLRGADLTNARLDSCDLRGVSLHDALTTGMTLHGSSQDG